MGVTLPEDYRAFLRRHDGQEWEFGVSILVIGGRLAPLEAVVRQYADMAAFQDDPKYLDEYEDGDRVRRVTWFPGRVDIGGQVDFDYTNTQIDLIPGPAGLSGQVIAEGMVLADSFTDYVRKVVLGLEGVLLAFENTENVIESITKGVAAKPKDYLLKILRERLS